MKRVTVIIPVYNGEKYIKRCIESVIIQTYKDIEIIIINNGSTDKTINICEKFKRKDKRIKIINSDNKGVSNARNLGIIAGTGEYFAFIDADDTVEIDYIEKLLNNCLNNNADICSCGINFISENDDFIKCEKSKKKIEELSNVELFKEFLKEKEFTCVVWGKLFRKKLFNDLKFNPTTVIAEDLEVMYKLLNKVNKGIIINECLYNYRINSDSVKNGKYNKSFLYEIEISNNIIHYVEEKYKNLKKYAIKRYLKINYINYIKIIKSNNETSYLNNIRNNVKKYQRYIFFDTTLKEQVKLIMILFFPSLLKLIYKRRKK